MPRVYTRTDPIVRFKRRLKPQSNGCIFFHNNPQSYGVVSLRRDETGIAAHRLAWELANGPIPDGLFVLHKCDNPSCCNPEHLFLGTAADNAEDAMRKGRLANGQKHGMAKLTVSQVLQIRKLYALGGTSQRELARLFGVVQGTIAFCLKGKTWRLHVEASEHSSIPHKGTKI